MRRILALIFIASIMFVSCDKNGNEYDTKDVFNFLGTIIIDSCEYVDGYNRLSHKGNCKFCKEREEALWNKRKEELKELLSNGSN